MGYNIIENIWGGISMKIEVTPKAKEELNRVLESREDNKPLRIYIASYG